MTIRISETLLETIIIASVRVVVALFSVDLSQDRILVSLHLFHLSVKLCEGIYPPPILIREARHISSIPLKTPV